MNIFLLILLLLAETKNLFIICVFFFFFFSYQKQILNVKTTEIHDACHTFDNLPTFLTTVYQQCEKTKGFALMLASYFFINKYVFIKLQLLFISENAN